MDSLNVSSAGFYKTWWPGHVLDQHLPPCVFNVAEMVINAQPYTWMQILLVVLVLGVLYYYLVLPMNYVKNLSEVGYGHLLDGGVGLAQLKGKTKREMVREVRRMRKIGNLPPVYPNGWFMLLESDNLGPGEVKHVAALGENFAVFRTQEGVVHVLDAYCPHLGANMAVGGAVRGDCLECPFHGWRFKGEDGKCTTVPYSEKVPDFAKVKRWTSYEVNKFIFVWYHAEGEEPNWRPSPIPQIESGEWKYRGRNEFLINSHIEEIPENGGDVAHLNAIHAPNVMAGSDLRFIERLVFSFARHVWSAQWQPCADAPYQATMHLHHEVRLFNKVPVVNMDVRAEQIGPAYVELHLKSSFGTMTILQTVTPVEPLLQKLVHRIYCPPLLSLFATFTLYAESIMVERDIMVWNHKKYIDKPLLVKEDHSIRRHRRWYSQFYSENSPQFSFQKDNMDW
ncbi:hypothetical protein ANN_00476 [Periplaneta americana]|uniref:cholesterol 7-desaturase n=1 Tax=Periplaneta americana TaxID=6978 RepID=A0ABQ8TQV9_PERAM|nr:hypothetical protein ANN_00476 [Periplaneta americana]